MRPPVAGLFPAVSVWAALRRLRVGAALCHLSQRGKQRGSCSELRLPVYATFANSRSRSGGLRGRIASFRANAPRPWWGASAEKFALPILRRESSRQTAPGADRVPFAAGQK